MEDVFSPSIEKTENLLPAARRVKTEFPTPGGNSSSTHNSYIITINSFLTYSLHL